MKAPYSVLLIIIELNEVVSVVKTGSISLLWGFRPNKTTKLYRVMPFMPNLKTKQLSEEDQKHVVAASSNGLFVGISVRDI